MVTGPYLLRASVWLMHVKIISFSQISGMFQSSSRMRVIYHNWSATKQRPHLQSVAEISHHSVLSGDRIRQCETSSGYDNDNDNDNDND